MHEYFGCSKIGGLESIDDIGQLFDGFLFVAELIVLTTNSNKFVMKTVGQQWLKSAGDKNIDNLQPIMVMRIVVSDNCAVSRIFA